MEYFSRSLVGEFVNLSAERRENVIEHALRERRMPREHLIGRDDPVATERCAEPRDSGVGIERVVRLCGQEHVDVDLGVLDAPIEDRVVSFDLKTRIKLTNDRLSDQVHGFANRHTRKGLSFEGGRFALVEADHGS